MTQAQREVSGQLYRVRLLEQQLAESKQRLANLEARHGIQARDAIAIRPRKVPKVM